jgi:hypothetical protein
MPIRQPSDESYSEKEAQERFEAALRAGLKTPHRPLKEKPKTKKSANESDKKIPNSRKKRT